MARRIRAGTFGLVRAKQGRTNFDWFSMTTNTLEQTVPALPEAGGARLAARGNATQEKSPRKFTARLPTVTEP